jgi:hypothetical protein
LFHEAARNRALIGGWHFIDPSASRVAVLEVGGRECQAARLSGNEASGKLRINNLGVQ